MKPSRHFPGNIILMHPGYAKGPYARPESNRGPLSVRDRQTPLPDDHQAAGEYPNVTAGFSAVSTQMLFACV